MLSDFYIKEHWKDSVYSDSGKGFVTREQKNSGELFHVSLQMLKGAPVSHVFLRYIVDGAHTLLELQPETHTRKDLVSYRGTAYLNQNEFRYQFYLIDHEDNIYYYTQKGITSQVQDEIWDFVIYRDYVQPEWVKSAVFYQIFPERFANGDPSLSVKSGEYTDHGHPSIGIENWNERPTPYDQSFCLDFYGGDLKGIEEKIPYLKELGINAIYLNPIYKAPSVHKYDATDFEEIDPHFGGNEGFASLMKALHANGIRLVLDISINHTGRTHKFFQDKELRRKFYRHTKDGDVLCWRNVPELPALNYESVELRKKLYLDETSVIKKWLKPPYCIDGWRFDVADVMAKHGPLQLDHEVWQEIRKSIREENDQAYILSEDWTDCPSHLQGSEWDSCMNYYGFTRIMRPFLKLPDPYLAHNPLFAKGSAKISAEQVKERFTSFFAQLPFAIWQNQFNLLDSHDIDRIHNFPEVDTRELRGAVIVQFTMIGTPSVYYGDEAEIDGWVGSNEGCRFPMPWDKDFKESQSYKLHKKLAALKTENAALTQGSFRFLYAKEDIIAFARFDTETCFITIMSVSNKDQCIELHPAELGFGNAAVSECLDHEFKADWKADQSLMLQVKAHETYLLMLKERK